ncbi:MAG: diacylglycerol kinase family lipid kinase [Anaerolineales bacterium]
MSRSKQSRRKIFTILNPVAGRSGDANIHELLDKQLTDRGIDYEIYETTGEGEISEVSRRARQSGFDIVVAAGGDGTVAAVLNGLVHSEVPMGILPVGTGNGLARALKIPLKVEEALQTITDEHQVLDLDTMRVGKRYFVMNVSIGISSRAMKDTPPDEKQKKGLLAYVQTILEDLEEVETSRFQLTIDGHELQVDASEVLVSNGKIIKKPPFLFGTRETMSDGRLDINVLKAKQTREYLQLAWDLLVDPEKSKSVLKDLTVREKVRIQVQGDPQPVQADGELIGESPVEVVLVPKSVHVIAPYLAQ